MRFRVNPRRIEGFRGNGRVILGQAVDRVTAVQALGDRADRQAGAGDHRFSSLNLGIHFDVTFALLEVAIEALGKLSNSFLIGFGFSHWQHTHPIHHSHPNTEGVDPDMESRGYALYDAAVRRVHGLTARMQPFTLIVGFLFWGFAIRIVAVAFAPSIDAGTLRTAYRRSRRSPAS